jgi:hypothetical protein
MNRDVSRALVSQVASAFQNLFGAIKQLTIARTQQSVVPDFHESLGQDVLKKSPDEFFCDRVVIP